MSEEQGVTLYSAVERIVESPDSIIERVDAFEQAIEDDFPEAEDGEIIERAADRIIQFYANNTMIAGGLSSAPALIPGVGTFLAVVPGNLADMTLCLKYEVEMALALSALYGFNIHDDHERSLAFLIASVTTYELLDNERGILKDQARAVGDIARVPTQAVWNYTPRQVGKSLARVFVGLALKSVNKSLFKALPVIGVGVSAVGNRLLTSRVGERARDALRYRVASEYA